MAESLQHKLDRIRSPRVQITYDVEIGNAIEMKELPFVVGILADLSGMPEEALPKLKERKFVQIDRDNFDEVLKSLKPRLALRVANCITGQGETNVELTFSSIEEFEPVPVIKQIPALAELYEARVRLKDLLGKLDGNDKLEGLLEELMASPESQTALEKEVIVHKEIVDKE